VFWKGTFRVSARDSSTISSAPLFLANRNVSTRRASRPFIKTLRTSLMDEAAPAGPSASSIFIPKGVIISAHPEAPLPEARMGTVWP
jgi:hypothetical protein